MRALRDFNMPKIVTDDIPVFLGLVGDLFPALDVPRRRAPHLEQMVRQSTLELRLQPEESFILKVQEPLLVLEPLGCAVTAPWLSDTEPRLRFPCYTNLSRTLTYPLRHPDMAVLTKVSVTSLSSWPLRRWKHEYDLSLGFQCKQAFYSFIKLLAPWWHASQINFALFSPV